MDRKAREFKLSRGSGAQPHVREWIAQENAKLQWYATCRSCGARREGTPAELAKPCECAHGDQG